MQETYDYFDHEADIGIIGRGATIEEAFVNAAHAVFAYMANLSEVKLEQTIYIEFAESDVELALVEWLNALLGHARAERLVLAKFTLRCLNHRWIGSATGGKWQESLERGTEVKGATLTMLSVKAGPAGWEARCVVDV